MIRAICGALLAIVLAGCWESDYNAYFYYPHSTRSDYLGVVTGLDACRRAATSHSLTVVS